MNPSFVTNIHGCIDSATALMQGNLQLVTYSHVPVAVISVLIGLFVIFKNRKDLSARVMFFLSMTFAAWVLSNLISWLSSNSVAIAFAWSLFGIINSLLFLFCLYLVFSYKNDTDLPLRLKILLGLFFLPIVVMTPTNFNVGDFNYAYCYPVDNQFLNYFFYFQIIITLITIVIAIWRYVHAERQKRHEIVLISVAVSLFLLSIFGTGYLADAYERYDIEVYGVFSMPLFLGFLGYIIVKFKAFNVKLLGTQALVWAQIILIGSQFLFVRNNTNRILTAVTLVVSAWLGLIIVRSVKKEVEARETIEGLAVKLKESNDELEVANDKLKVLDQQKSEFVSIASHQLRSPLTVIKGYLSMFLEGEPDLADITKGTITHKGVEVMRTMFESTNRLAHIIEDFLNVSRIEQGRMKYEMSEFDLRHTVMDVVEELKGQVADHHLTLDFKDKTPSEWYTVTADVGKLRQVVANVIDNAIKYTPQGGITVYLERLKDSIRISVKDTGIGISAENLKNLFQKFSRAANAGKVNVTGSGLGLFVAVEIMKAHGGLLSAESDGEGKGSTFIIELPLTKN